MAVTVDRKEQRVRRGPTLTLEQRAERHKLLVRDALAISSLLCIVLLLSFFTYLIFHSYVQHRQELGHRWRERGEAALAHGKAAAAVGDLRSALEYDPDNQTLETELATALMEAGSTREALVYFNTLHEARPGDGVINLQLARLAAQQNNVGLAVEYYEAALDGTWYGDGFLRRREVRLELARYLIKNGRYDDARTQLLVAAGNAADNHPLQLEAAGLLEQAQGDAEAFDLYRRTASFRDTRTAALLGAGRTAAALGRFRVARTTLAQAVAQPDFPKRPTEEQKEARALLSESEAVMALYPSDALPPAARARRTADLATVARAELASCTAPPAAAPTLPSVVPGRAASEPAGDDTASEHTLRSALGALAQRAQTLAGVRGQGAAAPAAPATTPVAAPPNLGLLATRWQGLPADGELERELVRNPGAVEPTLELTYTTARDTAQVCGPPTGQAALLLEIARAGDEVELP